MLNWLKDLVSPIRKADPELGSLRYLRDTRTWEGWVAFRPTSTQVEVLLTGPVSGPSQEQREFLKQVTERYSELWPSVERELLDAHRSDDKSTARFVLKAIDLPELASGEPEWELCYELDSAAEMPFFAVQLKGWRPTNVSVEC